MTSSNSGASGSHIASSLPPPRPNQHYVSISPISAGTITLPSSSFVSPVSPGEPQSRTVPSLSFLIAHPGLTSPPPAPLARHIPTHEPFHLLFDLGLRKSIEAYLPKQQKHLEGRRPWGLRGVRSQLEEGGVDVCTVKGVILSHVHYDHHGDPEDFPEACFVVGEGSLAVLRDGLGGTTSHQCFDAGLFEGMKGRVLGMSTSGNRAVEDDWDQRGQVWKEVKIGLCERTWDLLGDGSVYVIDAPGHLPGHINLLCRLTSTQWVMLAGDSYHDARLLTGGKEIGFWKDAEGRSCCIHVDVDGAREHLTRLRALQELGVEIVAAHDEGWFEQNRCSRMFPNQM